MSSMAVSRRRGQLSGARASSSAARRRRSLGRAPRPTTIDRLIVALTMVHDALKTGLASEWRIATYGVGQALGLAHSLRRTKKARMTRG